MRIWLRLLCCVAALWPAGIATAQDYPNKPIRLIVPFPAGGPNDIIARVVGQKMSEALGQPVLIDNRGGAGGVTGTDQVAKARAGRIHDRDHQRGRARHQREPAGQGSLRRHQGFRADHARRQGAGAAGRCLQRACEIGRRPRDPGEGKSAAASTSRRPAPAACRISRASCLKLHAAIDIVHVPYRGAAPAVNDLLGNQVQIMFADIPVLLPHVKSGALKAIAVGSKTRAPALPDIAPLAELGFPQIEAENWYGMVAPAGTPSAVVAKLNATTLAALRDPEVMEKLASQGAILAGGTPGEFAAYIRSEIDKWAKVVQASGAKGN